MTYRTKRPPTRKVLAFGVGATLAIMQLGAGCVPTGPAYDCTADGADRCVDNGGDGASDAAGEGGDAK